MFFDNLEEIPKLAEKCGCTIFVIPNKAPIVLPNAEVVRPGEAGKNGIIIDQVKAVTAHTNTKQQSSRYIIIREAEQMNLNAANAFLKNLEEPKENYHYILQTETPSSLLPTILSRSEIFILKQKNPLDTPIDVEDEIKDYAKKLISSKEKDLPALAETISKAKKDNSREFALKILKVAVEMSYKSYFKTNNQLFIKKADSLVHAYEAIMMNGNIKLHLVADML